MSAPYETRLLLGKLLGELYRTQKKVPDCRCAADDAHIYGLLNGFEDAVDHELEMLGYVSKAQVTAVMDVLDPYFQDPTKLKTFKGYYDIENELTERGVDRSQAIKILRRLKAQGAYTDVIAKMDSSGSPAECRTFEISEWGS